MYRRAFLNPFAMFQTRVVGDQARFKELEIEGVDPAEGTAFFLKQGAAPQHTITRKGASYDGVLYLDAADGRVKCRTRDGRIFAMTQI